MATIAMQLQPRLLPQSRLGPPPQMSRSLPHIQTDQFPPADTVKELVKRCLEMPHVRFKQSRMASPESHALYLADAFAAGPPEAFIDGHEFCHIHPLPEGSIHLTLPQTWRDEAIRLGWGERHPIAAAGILPTLLTVYAPRGREEMHAVLGLIVQSWLFAQGKLPDCGTERLLREVR
jgi:hypothetical protein